MAIDTTSAGRDEVVDHTVAKADLPILSGANAFKLGVFSTNVSTGHAGFTLAPETVRLGGWDEQRRLARKAEEIGIEAFIAVARWKSIAGPERVWSRQYEAFTWAAGLAEATERIQILATFHVPFVSPITAAKMTATVDHISHGRVGVNLTAGYFEPEFRMFGTEQRPHDERYAVADEWIRIVKRLWTEEEDFEFDFDGRYFHLEGAESYPKPVQYPYPVIMTAGSSDQGRKLAYDHADLLFMSVPDVDRATELAGKYRAEADAAGRSDLALWTVVHVVCKDTEQEVKQFVDYYAGQQADWDSAARYKAIITGGDVRSMVNAKEDSLTQWLVRGGAIDIAGTPEQVVEQLKRLSDAGLAGAALALVDYDEGLERMEKQILPLMRSAGLRA